MSKLYKAVEVALLLDISVPTLNNWYKFKRYNPDNEMSKLLPQPIQKAEKQTRYWTDEDIPKMIEFKSHIVEGRNGFMGSVTQQYCKYRKDKNYEEA